MRAMILAFVLALAAGPATAAAPQHASEPAHPSEPAGPSEPWMVLPPTPTLPQAVESGLAPVNGIRIWYARFGKRVPGEAPVLLLHGGLANANYWGNQVRALAPHHQVIVMDSRGHGRTTRNTKPYGYDLMASDVLALLDYLKVEKVALVGWSDGAIIGLDIAMKHPERLTRLFAFAANYDPTGVADSSQSRIVNAYVARAGKEYETLSATPREYQSFVTQITHMWNSQPHWTRGDFAKIHVPVWIVDGDHDEMITPDQPRTMFNWIKGARLLIEPGVSHFAFLQAPEQFNADVARFLDEGRAVKTKR